jgi:hypothetical protein
MLGHMLTYTQCVYAAIIRIEALNRDHAVLLLQRAWRCTGRHDLCVCQNVHVIYVCAVWQICVYVTM